jgi:hypothetical protein
VRAVARRRAAVVPGVLGDQDGGAGLIEIIYLLSQRVGGYTLRHKQQVLCVRINPETGLGGALRRYAETEERSADGWQYETEHS